jgi:hypothetical protein
MTTRPLSSARLADMVAQAVIIDGHRTPATWVKELRQQGLTVDYQKARKAWFRVRRNDDAVAAILNDHDGQRRAERISRGRPRSELMVAVDEAIAALDPPFMKRQVVQVLLSNLNMISSGSVAQQLMHSGASSAVIRRLHRKTLLPNGRRVRVYAALSADQDAEWVQFANNTDPDVIARVEGLRRDLRDEIGLTAEELRVVHDLMVEEHQKGNINLTIADVVAMVS